MAPTWSRTDQVQEQIGQTTRNAVLAPASSRDAVFALRRALQGPMGTAGRWHEPCSIAGHRREASNMVDTKQLKATLQRELDSLVRTRDELRVQASLAKADARKEWDRLEAGLLRVQDEIKRMGEHSKDAVHEIATASRTLLEELKHGYERIKRDLQAN
jgi:hypothetical protein